MTAKTPDSTIINALSQTMGNISTAARKLGISRTTIHTRINQSSDVKEAYEEYREQAIDNAESALQRAVLNGDGWAVCFSLKTIGKSRGYTERIEQEITGTHTIKMENLKELSDKDLKDIITNEPNTQIKLE